MRGWRGGIGGGDGNGQVVVREVEDGEVLGLAQRVGDGACEVVVGEHDQLGERAEGWDRAGEEGGVVQAVFDEEKRVSVAFVAGCVCCHGSCGVGKNTIISRDKAVVMKRRELAMVTD